MSYCGRLSFLIDAYFTVDDFIFHFAPLADISFGSCYFASMLVNLTSVQAKLTKQKVDVDAIEESSLQKKRKDKPKALVLPLEPWVIGLKLLRAAIVHTR